MSKSRSAYESGSALGVNERWDFPADRPTPWIWSVIFIVVGLAFFGFVAYIGWGVINNWPSVMGENPWLRLTGDWLALIITIILILWAMVEFMGKHISLHRPYIRPNFVKWDATDVALAGLAGALCASIGAFFGAIRVGSPPFVVGLQPLYFTMKAALGLCLGPPAVLGVMLGHMVWDMLMGYLAFWSICGLAHEAFISLTPYVIFRDPRKVLQSKSEMFKFMTCHWMTFRWVYLCDTTADLARMFAPGAIYLRPFFPGLYAMWVVEFISLPIWLRVVTPLFERAGLLSVERHVPPTVT